MVILAMIYQMKTGHIPWNIGSKPPLPSAKQASLLFQDESLHELLFFLIFNNNKSHKNVCGTNSPDIPVQYTQDKRLLVKTISIDVHKNCSLQAKHTHIHEVKFSVTDGW